jgi:hypothetical protein
MSTALVVNTFTESLPIAPVAQVAADAGGNTVQNGPTVFLEITNGGSGSATVTIPYVANVDGQTVSPRVYTLAAAAKLKAGPFNQEFFGTILNVTASATTVTLAAYQLGE